MYFYLKKIKGKFQARRWSINHRYPPPPTRPLAPNINMVPYYCIVDISLPRAVVSFQFLRSFINLCIILSLFFVEILLRIVLSLIITNKPLKGIQLRDASYSDNYLHTTIFIRFLVVLIFLWSPGWNSGAYQIYSTETTWISCFICNKPAKEEAFLKMKLVLCLHNLSLLKQEKSWEPA